MDRAEQKCPFCSFTSSSKGALKKHRSDAHSIRLSSNVTVEPWIAGRRPTA